MSRRQPPLPPVWIVTDARNDAGLETALACAARDGAGLVFRHYHLSPGQRSARFAQLARLARRRGLRVILAGSAREARRAGADGAYGGLVALGPPVPGILRLAGVHDLAELAAAHRARVDAVLLSPVHTTRSHPGARALGMVRWRLIAGRARVPVIALGGMDARRAAALGDDVAWAAIDAFA